LRPQLCKNEGLSDESTWGNLREIAFKDVPQRPLQCPQLKRIAIHRRAVLANSG